MTPRWNPYVSVTSADEVAARAEKLGGRILEAPFDVLDVGRTAVIQDPGGAYLPLWQAKKHHGAQLIKEPGALCWNELYTNDVDRVGRFYAELFGWKPRTEQIGDKPYTFFEDRGEQIAGMMKIDPAWGPMSPWWAIHFQVEDCDASAEKLKSLGGTLGRAPFDVPKIGRLAMVSDPQGAAFALFTPLRARPSA